MIVALLVAIAACSRASRVQAFDIATTTSVKNSGMLHILLLAFNGPTVNLHATGSGHALQMLEDGVVDLAMTHAPDAEERYLAAHPDWGYAKFAYNKFVLLGPPEDPAGVSQASDVVEAFRRIAASPVTFFSRGDQSGTHDKERALWRAAGIALASNHLIVVGNDMATTLSETDLRQGYTLSDEATFRQLQSRLDLVALLSEDRRLVNTYAVVYSRSNSSAVRFAEWLVSGDGSRRLDDYKIGESVAFRSWPEGCPANTPAAEPCS